MCDIFRSVVFFSFLAGVIQACTHPPPPDFEQEFLVREIDFRKYADQLQAGTRQAVEGALQGVPLKVADRVQAQGGKVTVASEVVVARPDLKAQDASGGGLTRKYEQVQGVYSNVTKEAVVGEGTRATQFAIVGTPPPATYTPYLSRVPGIARHEYGHMADYMGWSAQERLRWPGGRRSAAPDFKAAWAKDKNKMGLGVKEDLSYFVKQATSAASQDETFAEAFAQAVGGSGCRVGAEADVFTENFPTVMGLMKKILKEEAL